MKLNFTAKAQRILQPDPYILKDEKGYYIYVSGIEGVDGVPVFFATSLEGEWEYLGLCFKEDGCKEYWAPCVIKVDGKYYMYYSSRAEDCDDVHMQTLKVAVSDRPDGGFKYASTIAEPFSIDPHVVKSGEDYYVFYSINDYTAERAGTYIVVDRLKDMLTAEGKPVSVVVPSLEEEIFIKNRFKEGQDWYTIEGAFYFNVGNDHYLMYSANCYQSKYYFVGYSYAKTDETDLRKITFEKQPSADVYAPLLKRNDFETGTGHNSVLIEGDKLYVVYHGRDIGADESLDMRTARFCEMFADGSKLTVKQQ